jgi:hypothetical protein
MALALVTAASGAGIVLTANGPVGDVVNRLLKDLEGRLGSAR